MANETTAAKNVVTDAVRKSVELQMARMEEATKMAAEIEAKALERARQAMDESAKLARESLNWYAEMSAAWRKMAMDAARQAADLSGTGL